MRRYTFARNPIQQLRERWGLGATEQSQSVPTGAGPSFGVHPLPTVPRGEPAPYARPLPGLEGRPFFDAPDASDSGAVDYAARQRSQLDQVPKGEQAAPITVYPAWESRLEGMRDFLAVLQIPALYDPLIPTPGTFELTSYPVPQGYTAFWKQFRFFFDPVPAPLTLRNTLITLLIDGLVVADYFNLPLGPMMAAYQDCFPPPIAEGRRLSVRVQITQAVGDIDTEVFFPFALLYGNLRPRTGLGENREVGVRPPPPTIIQPVIESPRAAPPAPTSQAPPRFQLPFRRPQPPPPRSAGGFVKGGKNK